MYIKHDLRLCFGPRINPGPRANTYLKRDIVVVARTTSVYISISLYDKYMI